MSVRKVWKRWAQEEGTGVSAETGGQASASGSAPVRINNTVAGSGDFKGCAQDTAQRGSQPSVLLSLLWGLFSNSSSLVAEGRAVPACTALGRPVRYWESRGRVPRSLPFSRVAL